MKAWSGYYINEDQVKASASGGGATALSEGFIREKSGCVFGAAFSDDFKDVGYICVEDREALKRFRGSKYISSSKIFGSEGERRTVFELVGDKLAGKQYVLMIGLGCDIAALYAYLDRKKIDTEYLYTVDLICSGPTYSAVQRQYIENIEKTYRSCVTQFSMRYKKRGWTPFYLYIEMANGEKHIRTFYDSDYGYAFQNYKLKKCYGCRYRGENHPADIVIGDYWGIQPDMEGYCRNGVSVFLVRTEKGKSLMDGIDRSQFRLTEIDVRDAIRNNPMYSRHPIDYGKWEKFHAVFQAEGLRAAVIKTSKMNGPVPASAGKEIVLWGAGECFYENYPKVKELSEVRYVCDNDERKWNQHILEGIICISPQELKEIRNVFVVIMLENIRYAFQVVHQLLGLGISDFDIVANWLTYAEKRENRL